MKKVTREEIEAALELLGKARLHVSWLDLVVSDLAEKATNFIGRLEDRVIALDTEPEAPSPSEAGGTEGDLPTRDSMVNTIRETLKEVLGFEGVWGNPDIVGKFSYDEVKKHHDSLLRLKHQWSNLK